MGVPLLRCEVVVPNDQLPSAMTVVSLGSTPVWQTFETLEQGSCVPKMFMMQDGMAPVITQELSCSCSFELTIFPNGEESDEKIEQVRIFTRLQSGRSIRLNWAQVRERERP